MCRAAGDARSFQAEEGMLEACSTRFARHSSTVEVWAPSAAAAALGMRSRSCSALPLHAPRIRPELAAAAAGDVDGGSAVTSNVLYSKVACSKAYSRVASSVWSVE